jgi:serine/threonine protein phosphatase 1
MKFNNLREVIPANTEGKDYVFGDLHGSYDLFEKALNLLKFDKTKDRAFLVGDLCDRGPQSLECLQLLLEDWVYAVPGNHEQMLVEYVNHPFSPYGRAFIYNGGYWIENYLESTWDEIGLNKIIEKIKTLPRMLTVKDRCNMQVHIIHAELNVSWFDGPITDSDIENEKSLKQMLTLSSEDGEYSFWGRACFNKFYDHPNPSIDLLDDRELQRLKKFSDPGLSMIISGHSIMDKPLSFGNLLNIDTGAYLGKLSLYCIDDNTVYTLHKELDYFKSECNYIKID